MADPDESPGRTHRLREQHVASKGAALRCIGSANQPNTALSGQCRREWLVCVGSGNEDAVALAVEQVLARRQHGILVSSAGAGFQLALRTAVQLRSRLPEATIGVHCPDLRPQDLLCRLPREVDLAWIDVPASTSAILSMAAVMGIVRSDYAWKGQACGDVGDCTCALRDKSVTVCARDSGQFDLLACHAPASEQRTNAADLAVFKDIAWPLDAALVIQSGTQLWPCRRRCSASCISI